MGQVWVEGKWDSPLNEVQYVQKVEVKQTIFSELMRND